MAQARAPLETDARALEAVRAEGEAERRAAASLLEESSAEAAKAKVCIA